MIEAPPWDPAISCLPYSPPRTSQQGETRVENTGARKRAMVFRCDECGVRIQRAGALRSPAYRRCSSKGRRVRTRVARWPLDTGAWKCAMVFRCDECGVRIQRAGALRSPAYRRCSSKGRRVRTRVARWPLDTGAWKCAMVFRCDECGVRIQTRRCPEVTGLPKVFVEGQASSDKGSPVASGHRGVEMCDGFSV